MGNVSYPYRLFPRFLSSPLRFNPHPNKAHKGSDRPYVLVSLFLLGLSFSGSFGEGRFYGKLPSGVWLGAKQAFRKMTLRLV